jgi:membrane protease subunit (stomatin/prohibitin family)
MGRIIDVIQYTDPTGNEIVHKFPEHGQADVRFGSQLIVNETQAAVFFRDGKALDVFGPGRHTLSTANLPFMEKVLNFATQGQTPFTAEVCFISQKIFTDLKWGTPSPIDLQDPDLGWVSLRAFGTYSIRVGEPQLFVNTLVGTQGTYSSEVLSNFLRGSIRTHLNDLLSTSFKSYAQIRRDFEELAGAMKIKVKEDFEKYGIELRDFFIHDVSVPEEVQEAFKERAKMGALGDMGKYMQFKSAQAIGDMAKQPGGAAGQVMGMGAGLGVGMMMPQMMQQAMQQSQQPQAAPMAPAAPVAAVAAAPAVAMRPCPGCTTAVPENARFCANCGTQLAGLKCPGCQTDVAAGAKFCASCGTKLG